MFSKNSKIEITKIKISCKSNSCRLEILGRDSKGLKYEILTFPYRVVEYSKVGNKLTIRLEKDEFIKTVPYEEFERRFKDINE